MSPRATKGLHRALARADEARHTSLGADADGKARCSSSGPSSGTARCRHGTSRRCTHVEHRGGRRAGGGCRECVAPLAVAPLASRGCRECCHAHGEWRVMAWRVVPSTCAASCADASSENACRVPHQTPRWAHVRRMAPLVCRRPSAHLRRWRVCASARRRRLLPALHAWSHSPPRLPWSALQTPRGARRPHPRGVRGAAHGVRGCGAQRTGDKVGSRAGPRRRRRVSRRQARPLRPRASSHLVDVLCHLGSSVRISMHCASHTAAVVDYRLLRNADSSRVAGRRKAHTARHSTHSAETTHS